ncbi:MAG: sigma-70 family RNA polymerase sigma factor [Sediminibacterium sp.]|nr:sigma-70 family RNA polymerase sigma factor [Sediminibacterium sp.]
MDNKYIKDLIYQVAIYEDECAYRHLFNILFPSLQNFAYTFLKQRQTAEELASDILLDVWQKAKKYLEIENPKMYLLVSVKNASLRKLETNKKISTLPLENIKVEFKNDYGHLENNNIALENLVSKAIEQLPEKCKLIFKLAKEEKLRYREIAELLDISVKTIDSQLAIATKKISLALLEHKKLYYK